MYTSTWFFVLGQYQYSTVIPAYYTTQQKTIVSSTWHFIKGNTDKYRFLIRIAQMKQESYVHQTWFSLLRHTSIVKCSYPYYTNATGSM